LTLFDYLEKEREYQHQVLHEKIIL